VTRLETLGRCPLQYFFRYGLSARELDRPGAGYIVEPVDIGRHVHRLLERLLRGLLDDSGLLKIARGEAGDLALLIEKRVAKLFGEETERLAKRVSRRFPTLWEGIRDRWISALVTAAYWDTRRLLKEKARVVAVEETVEAELPAHDGEKAEMLTVEGRLDRLDALGENRLRVVDYKTGRVSFSETLDPSQALKGKRLQLALYRMLVAAAGPETVDLSAVDAEVLPVSPGVEPPGEDPAQRLAFNPTGDPTVDGAEFRRSLEHTLGTLVSLAREGRFPLSQGHHCRYCEYDPACRRTHPPSDHRVASAPSYAPYFALDAKSRRNPTPPPGGGARGGEP
jgi:RecB family exonuclease